MTDCERVSAIILNYNSGSDCEKCISFLQKQDYPNLDVIVVDNNSSKEDEIGQLKKFCHQHGVKLLLNGKNDGYSAGNNIGLKDAVKNGASWCMIINPDVELRDPSYISYVIRAKSNYKNVGVIGTNIVNPDGSRQNPSRNLTAFEEIFFPLEFLKQKLGVWDGYLSEDKTGYCEKVHGCCLFLNSEFLLKADFVDQNVFLYCEEPILSKQVLRYGYKELYIKEVTANHEHYRKEKAGNSVSRMLSFFKSREYYIRNYSGYNSLEKKLALLSRKLQLQIWERKR